MLAARRNFLVVACGIALVAGFCFTAGAQPYYSPWSGPGGYEQDEYGPGDYGPGGFRRGAFFRRGMPRDGGQQLSMKVAGQTRTYILIRPRTGRPLPTVLFLHGKGSNAERMRMTGFGRLGAREGFVTVFPNAVGGIWNVFPPGGPHPFGRHGDDTDFIQELVASLVARGIADPDRIYISGISFGGFMTLRMACVAPHLFAAVGVVLSSMLSVDGVKCHPSKPLPLVMINGTADTTVPYAGGHTRDGLSLWGTDRTLAFFRRLNGCSDDNERSEISLAERRETLPIKVHRWKHCSGAPVTLYSVIGGGHRAPRGMEPGAEGFTVARTMWEFFRDKSTRVQ